MSEPGERCVCDLTLLMRARLLCGLYSRRAVPPRWRRLALAYCLTAAAVSAFYIYHLITPNITSPQLYTIVLVSEYLLACLLSLWTQEEYVYSFFTQNKVTDITLDSRVIFGSFQKQLKQAYIITLPWVIAVLGTSILNWYSLGFVRYVTDALPSVFYEMSGIFVSSSKLLVMGLFSARMLVLKRRLQRYGFRTPGRASPQPYCQVYDKILQMLGATANPLKLLLFFDLVTGCSKIIIFIVYQVQLYQMYEARDASTGLPVMLNLYFILVIGKILVLLFGHVVMLEWAAVHCDEMALFTVTQLIKNPTVAERRRMRLFLGALERRGARYRVLRALPLDARFVLRALAFCTAQIILFFNTIRG